MFELIISFIKHLINMTTNIIELYYLFRTYVLLAYFLYFSMIPLHAWVLCSIIFHIISHRYDHNHKKRLMIKVSLHHFSMFLLFWLMLRYIVYANI